MELMFLIVVGTSIWMAVESSSFGYHSGDVKGLAAMGPAGWFFSGLLLWIVAFPVYLAKRSLLKEAGDRNKAMVAAGTRQKL